MTGAVPEWHQRLIRLLTTGIHNLHLVLVDKIGSIYVRFVNRFRACTLLSEGVSA